MSTPDKETMDKTACSEVDALRAKLTASESALAQARDEGEKGKADSVRAQQLWSDTTAELLVCRNALNMLKKDIKPMAAQIIHPKDNVMSRMMATIDNALQATYAVTRAASEPSAALRAASPDGRDAP